TQASVPAQTGATYQWTITGGTITDGGTSPVVTFTAGASGEVVLGVSIVANGCTSTGSVTLPIVAAPTAAIGGPDSICINGSVTLDAGEGFATYLWSTGETTRTITKTQTATTTYQVTVTNAAGCAATAGKTVAVALPANATITSATSVTPASTTNRASVPVQASATYVWGITNGTITSGLGTNTILFTAGNSGAVTLTVEVNAGGCAANGQVQITIAEVNADLTISKTGPATVQTGATFNYLLSIANNGPATATTVTVTDDLPPGVTVGNVAVTGGWECSTTALTVVCRRATVPINDASTITLTVVAPQQTGIITNVASVRALSPDPDMATNGARVVTTVEAPPPVCNTTAPTLTSPADGANNLTSPVTLQWTAVDGATAYEIWVATNGNAPAMATTSTGTTTTVSVSNGTTSWYVIARLPGTCAPTRSLTRTFTVPVVDTCAQNPAPAITAPAAGATTSEDVTITWNAAAGAVGYRVIVRVGDGAPQDVGTTSTATTLTTTLPAGAVTATIEAIFSGCPATLSPAVSFTVAAPDPCANRAIPVLASPADQATVSTASVQFTWTAVENASEYRVVILEHEEGEEEEPEEVGRTSGTTLSTTLEPGTTTWWVEALFKGCPSTTSAERTLTIPPANVCPSDAASLISPPDKANTADASVTFRWDPKSGAIGYELWAIYAGGTPTLLQATDAKSLTVTRNAVSGATEWFVRTLYDRCPFVESEHRTFTNEPPPDCSAAKAPSLLNPGDGDEVTSPVSFRWSPVTTATGYELYVSSPGAGEPTRLYSGTTVPST
ncbi:MAG: hypothetical protein WA208_09770, partial [Thermoanaerobaculia bacterium]